MFFDMTGYDIEVKIKRFDIFFHLPENYNECDDIQIQLLIISICY